MNLAQEKSFCFRYDVKWIYWEGYTEKGLRQDSCYGMAFQEEKSMDTQYSQREIWLQSREYSMTLVTLFLIP